MIASSSHQAWLFYSPLARQAARLKDDLLDPVDQLLDDPALVDLVRQCLAKPSPRSTRTGRMGMAPDRLLRCSVMKHVKGWSFRDLERELRSNLVIPHMREQGHGTIINVTSSTGIAPMPLVAIYAASKCAVEGFTESLSYEMELVGIRMRLVEPGFAPSTNLTANGGVRMQGLTPPPYSEFAQAYFARMQNYPTDYSTEQDIVEAVFAAATDRGDHLRYLAGPDTKLLASLRWTTSEEKYLAEMREMFRPVPTS